MRTIFIGDVHGCLAELNELLERISPQKNDRIIFLGDIINKWPDPIGVLRLIRWNWYECLCGNHEFSYRKSNGEAERYRTLRSNLSNEEHDWLMTLPGFIDEPHFTAVHGGLIPGKPPSEADLHILCEIRTWDGIWIDLKNKSNPAWHTLYTWIKPVFYGHWAVQRLNLQEKTFWLDDACVYGGSLCAYALETGELYRVLAKRAYVRVEGFSQ